MRFLVLTYGPRVAVVLQEFLQQKGAEGGTVVVDKIALVRTEVRDLLPFW